jgi:predicted dehydrogenase
MRSLVVGAGAIARQHLGALAGIDGLDEVAVCDLSAVTARAMADRFGLERWFTDVDAALEAVSPDVVHVTTPPLAHFPLAMQALRAGCHVLVEKPATTDPAQLPELVREAQERGLHLVEDYNYVFNRRVREARDAVAAGDFGDLVHVEVLIALDIFGPGSAYLDPATNRSFQDMAGGPVADFLPHLASVAHAFVGPHVTTATSWMKTSDAHPFAVDEFRALVEGDAVTASLGFSARAQPDLFSVTVHGTRRRTRINLFEGRAAHERQLGITRPLIPLLNGLRESVDTGLGSLGGLLGKLSGGPGAYEGLWTLVADLYSAIQHGTAPPVGPTDVLEVNALIAALTEGVPR